jgi:hypothetical protein
MENIKNSPAPPAESKKDRSAEARNRVSARMLKHLSQKYLGEEKTIEELPDNLRKMAEEVMVLNEKIKTTTNAEEAEDLKKQWREAERDLEIALITSWEKNRKEMEEQEEIGDEDETSEESKEQEKKDIKVVLSEFVDIVSKNTEDPELEEELGAVKRLLKEEIVTSEIRKQLLQRSFQLWMKTKDTIKDDKQKKTARNHLRTLIVSMGNEEDKNQLFSQIVG